MRPSLASHHVNRMKGKNDHAPAIRSSVDDRVGYAGKSDRASARLSAGGHFSPVGGLVAARPS
jgi:hypothetical protein